MTLLFILRFNQYLNFLAEQSHCLQRVSDLQIAPFSSLHFGNEFIKVKMNAQRRHFPKRADCVHQIL